MKTKCEYNCESVQKEGMESMSAEVELPWESAMESTNRMAITNLGGNRFPGFGSVGEGGVGNAVGKVDVEDGLEDAGVGEEGLAGGQDGGEADPRDVHDVHGVGVGESEAGVHSVEGHEMGAGGAGCGGRGIDNADAEYRVGESQSQCNMLTAGSDPTQCRWFGVILLFQLGGAAEQRRSEIKLKLPKLVSQQTWVI